MKATRLSIPDVVMLEPRLFEDERGCFLESFNQSRFEKVVGCAATFVQDNHVRSRQSVVRGLHYQIRRPQGKLVRVIAGEIFDVAVDLRRHSATFGRWAATVLDAKHHRQLWVPPGFAHGYLVLSDHAEVLYKATDYWAPEHERCIAWNDASLAIEWPIAGEPLLSARDAAGATFDGAEFYD